MVIFEKNDVDVSSEEPRQWSTDSTAPRHSQRRHTEDPVHRFRKSGGNRIERHETNTDASYNVYSHHNKVRLMTCFDTPPQTTIFGTKNSEHWDSFKIKYAPSFKTTKLRNHHNNPPSRVRTVFLRRRNNTNHEDRSSLSRMRRRRKRSEPKEGGLLWKVFLGCWQKRPPHPEEDRMASMGDPLAPRVASEDYLYCCYQKPSSVAQAALSSHRRTKGAPLVERYSEYFDRRKNKANARLG